MKAKSLDCVKMKNCTQTEPVAEYQFSALPMPANDANTVLC